MLYFDCLVGQISERGLRLPEKACEILSILLVNLRTSSRFIRCRSVKIDNNLEIEHAVLRLFIAECPIGNRNSCLSTASCIREPPRLN